MGTTLMRNCCKSGAFLLYPETLQIDLNVGNIFKKKKIEPDSIVQLCNIGEAGLEVSESLTADDHFLNFIEPAKADHIKNIGNSENPIFVGKNRSKEFCEKISFLVNQKRKKVFEPTTEPYTGVEARIEFTGKIPPGGSGYFPATHTHQKILKTKVDKMVKQKIGRWTSDASNCHMFLVDKENGSPKDSEEAWRPVCSLVHVNKYIKPREYNAEPIGLLIQKLQYGKLFNKFDHPNAYHGLKMVSDQKIIECTRQIVIK